MTLLKARGSLAALLGLSLACGGGGGENTPAAPSAGNTPLVLRRETAHFRIYGDRVADAVLGEVAERLEKVWEDQAVWAAEVQSFFGRRIDTSGYVTSSDEIRVLAVPAVARNATHEFCHAVSLYVNPGFANNPRWLWESVALYENREFVDPRSLDYLVRGTPPTLQQLNADVTASRQV